ncbi:hypothetical protein QP862_12575 [Lacticaseibacillus rhamnosus]|uniref:hypothetical protein n=1 Tax=Lacticaseibacillus rhamnosus TaxID=47715 RepID=UPI00254D9723|nr:hypothetical protein [Lacticaseibacillus rhamnosus]MDK8385719.1 hypothetical protein [Lacticaseibacillus rhamnosus]MDK8752011.1 hypothetical protein [Lacticaseibacillus rhamnosus]
MDNYDKARKVLQSMALSKIAQETGISIGQIWHYRDRYEGIQKAPPAYVERIASLYRKKKGLVGAYAGPDTKRETFVRSVGLIEKSGTLSVVTDQS